MLVAGPGTCIDSSTTLKVLTIALCWLTAMVLSVGCYLGLLRVFLVALLAKQSGSEPTKQPRLGETHFSGSRKGEGGRKLRSRVGSRTCFGNLHGSCRGGLCSRQVVRSCPATSRKQQKPWAVSPGLGSSAHARQAVAAGRRRSRSSSGSRARRGAGLGSQHLGKVRGSPGHLRQARAMRSLACHNRICLAPRGCACDGNQGLQLSNRRRVCRRCRTLHWGWLGSRLPRGC